MSLYRQDWEFEDLAKRFQRMLDRYSSGELRHMAERYRSASAGERHGLTPDYGIAARMVEEGWV